jgi:hypothetical protein
VFSLAESSVVDFSLAGRRIDENQHYALSVITAEQGSKQSSDDNRLQNHFHAENTSVIDASNVAWSGRGKPQISRGMSSYLFTPQEQALASNLDEAIVIKFLEAFLPKNVDWEDFAVLATTPPGTMSKYNTTMHEIKDIVKHWKGLCAIDDELLKYFASEMLSRDLPALVKPGVAQVIGLTDDQFEKIILYWHELREQWMQSQKDLPTDLLFHDTKPTISLSKEKRPSCLTN